MPAWSETADPETADAILKKGQNFQIPAGSLNRSGDEEGCRWENGQVFTPAGFPQAYRTLSKVVGVVWVIPNWWHGDAQDDRCSG